MARTPPKPTPAADDAAPAAATSARPAEAARQTRYFEPVAYDPPNENRRGDGWREAVTAHICRRLNCELMELDEGPFVYQRSPQARQLHQEMYLRKNFSPPIQRALHELGDFTEIYAYSATVDHRLRGTPDARRHALRQRMMGSNGPRITHDILVARDRWSQPQRLWVWIQDVVPWDEPYALNMLIAGATVDEVAKAMNAGPELITRWLAGPNVRGTAGGPLSSPEAVAAWIASPHLVDAAKEAIRFYPEKIIIVADGQAAPGVTRPLRRGVL